MDRRAFYDLWAWEYTRRNPDAVSLHGAIVRAAREYALHCHADYDLETTLDAAGKAIRADQKRELWTALSAHARMFYETYGYLGTSIEGYDSTYILEEAIKGVYLRPIEHRELMCTHKEVLPDTVQNIKDALKALNIPCEEHVPGAHGFLVKLEMDSRKWRDTSFYPVYEDRNAHLEKMAIGKVAGNKKLWPRARPAKFKADPKSYLSRAIGLWLWDSDTARGMTQGQAIKAWRDKYGKEEAVRDTYGAPVSEDGKKDPRAMLRRTHQTAVRCIAACEVW